MFGPPLEMFHCGGTAIVYNVTGHDEYIVHGRNALLAECHDEAAVVRFVRQLKDFSLFLEALKANAIDAAAQWPDWPASTAQFRDAMEKAAANAGCCRPAGPSGTALSTTAMVRCLCTPRSTPKPATCWAKPRRATASAEFVAFLADIVVNQPATQETHVIADNLSAHKTMQVTEFLDRNPTVHLHFTPTYSSWLNQVEVWFAKIERDVIARGVFTCVPDLRRKLMRYIRQFNKAPKTIKWRYRDPTRSITSFSAVTAH
jgi:transposase